MQLSVDFTGLRSFVYCWNANGRSVGYVGR
jgi:hypothetical protein